MTATNPRRILIVDDNRAIHDDFRKILGSAPQTTGLDDIEARLLGEGAPPRESGSIGEPYIIDSAFQGQEGLEKICRALEAGENYCVAFIDMRMPPGWDGIKTIGEIWAKDPRIQIVICSAYSDYSWDEILRKFGSDDRLLILKKPFDVAEVCQVACSLVEKWRRTGELLQANQELKHEVAERRNSERAARESEQRYALAAAGANDGLWDWDLKADTIYFSERWRAMLGMFDSDAVGRPKDWYDRVHTEDLPRLKADIADHLEGRTAHFQSEYRAFHQDSSTRWMLSRGMAVRDPSGTPFRVAGSQTDITDRKLAEQRLRHDAFHDALTGLSNRALLLDRLDHCLERARRSPGSLFGVLFMDVDRFKMINDSLGHSIGDQMLIGMAERLSSCVRTLDTVSCTADTRLARLGGDEFVLLLEDLTDAGGAVRVAERLLQSLDEPFLLEGQEVFASSSIGIAIYGPAYHRPEEILRDADTALYQAKAMGKGRYALFNAGMHERVLRRLQTESELRRAIGRDEFRLQYQPIVALADGTISGFEALVRWHHPEKGLIPPGDFIPVAEETGLIIPLGDWILRMACTEFAPLAEAALKRGVKITVHVNVSGKQFAQPGMPARIREILKDTGLKAEHLKLEITESALIDPSTIGELLLLKELDLQLDLDDFGTGYSSLSYLHRLPIDSLKIDRSFVAAMGLRARGDTHSDAGTDAIVEAVVALGHALGLTVIAEGVETLAQLNRLRALRCEEAQGYYFSRPVDLSVAAALLTSPGPWAALEWKSQPVAQRLAS